MARPKPDTDKIRSRLIAEAETQLEQTDGRRLVLSDIAVRLGMSQSYVYTFFPTKADLVRELASRWFEAIETVSAQAASADAPADARLERWVLSILQTKRDRFDKNPKLFRAYLELARTHMDLVNAHIAALRGDLTQIVRELVGGRDVDDTVLLIENATLLFRTPHNIAAYRERATDEAARAVCRILTSSLARSERD